VISHVGQRVQLLCAPAHKGIVSGVSAAGFTVVYDWPENLPPRRAGEPRQRYAYPASAAGRFGEETRDEIRVLDGDGAGFGVTIGG
jgi:hypothetical protein